MCVWGGKGDLKNPNHTLKEKHEIPLGRKKQSKGKFCFCLLLLQFHQGLKFTSVLAMRSEALGVPVLS